VEANAFALASHQYWGVWALIQARYSPIDFDYLGCVAARGAVVLATACRAAGAGALCSASTPLARRPRRYSQLRWGEYHRRKEEFLGAAREWAQQLRGQQEGQLGGQH
jgi:hypothetical protein